MIEHISEHIEKYRLVKMDQKKKELSESTSNDSRQINAFNNGATKGTGKYKLMQKLFIFTLKIGGISLLSVHHIHLLVLFPVIAK